MSVSAPEQFRANYQAGVAAFFALTKPVFEGVQAVIDLNVQASKAAVAESEATLKGALESGNPAEFLTQQIGASQQAAAKAISYGRHLVDIATTTQNEWIQAAQVQSGEQEQRFKAFSEGLTQNAPMGAESFVAAMNSTFAAVNNAAETLRGVTRQAIETAQSGFQNVVASAQEAAPVAVQPAAAKASSAKA
ncbi:TIGR01841 family phasin [Paraburkholderia silvatlantica]|uniref:Phasin family protein n=2 Tax=cellular organisms TaxID=131567 RepID=W2SQS0_NECAM|nr:TIGR01841 family phasin [Paraburkholderia silvatlantica]XP_013294202.1 phasin family protein [Necator americanus]ETN71975.1 phasin family protein [Necator americanus]MBB2926174.1 phasin family protein [Paraburkholderia silvatlantica]PVY26728.1 phasin family protein [Paraburkholderia silvatlantica]PXW33015.1 phasin family protein [Paraburkholderia silvatlantica]TDQ80675.1 phasin family protein [Paraburkholderia silvatlantica]